MPKKKYSCAGAPTLYKPEYCQAIIDYFDIEPYQEIEVKHIDKNGNKYSTFELRANDPRFLSAFARSIGVTHDTLLTWAEAHKEFSLALKESKTLQHNMISINALQNLYAQAFSIFMMKNIAGWRDQPKEETPDELINQKLDFTIDQKELPSRIEQFIQN